MRTVTLSAHFDGEHIRLDEPFPLATDARLLVTLVPEPAIDTERTSWNQLSSTGLVRAYSDDEPEYPASLVRPSSHAR